MKMKNLESLLVKNLDKEKALKQMGNLFKCFYIILMIGTSLFKVLVHK